MHAVRRCLSRWTCKERASASHSTPLTDPQLWIPTSPSAPFSAFGPATSSPASQAATRWVSGSIHPAVATFFLRFFPPFLPASPLSRVLDNACTSVVTLLCNYEGACCPGEGGLQGYLRSYIAVIWGLCKCMRHGTLSPVPFAPFACLLSATYNTGSHLRAGGCRHGHLRPAHNLLHCAEGRPRLPRIRPAG
jgi:hypothetical protein